MSKTLRIVPLLLAAAALLLLAVAGADGTLDAAELRRSTPDTAEPDLVSMVLAGSADPAVLVGRPAAPRPEPAAPRSGPAVIEVVDADGPCQDVEVFVFGLEEETPCRGRDTDKAGCVELKDVPYDGSVRVLVDGWPETPQTEERPERANARILGPRTTLRVAASLPLQITFRDVETGRVLNGLPYSLVGESSKDVTTTTTRRVTGKPDAYCSVWARPEAPRGLAGFDGLWFTGTLSRRTRAVRMEATLRHEAEVYVRAVDTEGCVVSDAEAVDGEVAGRSLYGVTSVPARGNLLHVRGIPFLRGERVRVLAALPDGSAWDEEEEVEVETPEIDDVSLELTWNGHFSYDAGFAAIACGELPPAIGDALVLTAVFDPHRPICGRATFLGGGHGDSFYRAPKVPHGRVVLTVLDRAGSPACGVAVRCLVNRRRTDLDGRAVFAKVPQGERALWLEEPGWVKTMESVEVRGGETTRVTLHEDEGGELLVRVVADEDGVALTGARIEVPDRLAWIDLEDGIQRLDVATNHEGERLLRHFPAGPARIHATWGSRRASAETHVVSGQRQTLEIRLP